MKSSLKKIVLIVLCGGVILAVLSAWFHSSQKKKLQQELSDRDSASAYRKGIELIHAKLNDLLRKRGVRPFESLGADFDPNVHQAVVHEASAEHREGEVIGELRRGYMLGDRLLRPAMVKVAKA